MDLIQEQEDLILQFVYECSLGKRSIKENLPSLLKLSKKYLSKDSLRWSFSDARRNPHHHSTSFVCLDCCSLQTCQLLQLMHYINYLLTYLLVQKF